MGFHFEAYKVPRLLKNARTYGYKYLGVDEHVVQKMRNLGYCHTTITGKRLDKYDLEHFVMLVFEKG